MTKWLVAAALSLVPTLSVASSPAKQTTAAPAAAAPATPAASAPAAGKPSVKTASAGSATKAASSDDADEVNLAQVRFLLATHNAIFFDANGKDAFKAGHLPGAVSFVPFDGEPKKLAAALPKNKDALIVAYCGNAQCSAWENAAKQIKALGYKNVHHYKPGVQGWIDAGGQPEKG